MSDGESQLRAAQPPTPLADWRASLVSAPSGASLLDRLLSPHDAAALVRQLPVEDLYSYIGRIGLEDSDGVLALASGSQVQGLVDIDTWQRDELSVERLDPWLTALMRAGPEILGARILELDDSMITFILRTSVRVLVIDDPETFDPPDIEHVLTPDGRLCICFPESAPRDLPIKIFLDWLIQHHPVYTVNLLVFSASALDSNLQEDAYRWRSARMADLGYVDYYEALKIYVSAPSNVVDEIDEINVVESPPSLWLKTLSRGKDRLEIALSSVEAEHVERVQASLAYAMNMALSADRVEAWDQGAQEAVVQRVHAGLALGLDSLNGSDASAEKDADLLARVPASTLFRIGYGRILDAAKAARAAETGRALAGVEGPYGAVDLPALQPWVESLTQRHPTMPSGRSPATSAELNEMALRAHQISDLGRVGATDRPVEVGAAQFVVTRFLVALLGIDSDGALPEDQGMAAHFALIRDGEIVESARDALAIWWVEQNGHHQSVPELILAEVKEQMGAVSPEAMAPELMPLLWLSKDT